LKDCANPKPAQPKPPQPEAPEPDTDTDSKDRQPEMQDWPSSLDELFLFDPNFESCW
jgi:hypothetical protein